MKVTLTDVLLAILIACMIPTLIVACIYLLELSVLFGQAR